MFSSVLLHTTFAALVACAGGALGVCLAGGATWRLGTLVYAAMGALLAVTLFDVLPDAASVLSGPAFALAALSGCGLFWLIARFVAPVCPACAISELGTGTALGVGRAALLLAAAMTVHSAMDGLAVAVGDAGRTNPALLAVVTLHKLPEGLALALLLRGAGWRRRDALLWTAAIESATIAGGLLGVFGLRGASPVLLAVLMAHVGGGFLFLAASTVGLFARAPRLPGRSVWVGGSLAFTLTALLLWGVHAWGR